MPVALKKCFFIIKFHRDFFQHIIKQKPVVIIQKKIIGILITVIRKCIFVFLIVRTIPFFHFVNFRSLFFYLNVNHLDDIVLQFKVTFIFFIIFLNLILVNNCV